MRFRNVMVFVLAFCALGALIPANASASDFRLRIDYIQGGVTQGVVITDIQNDASVVEGEGDQDGGAGTIAWGLPFLSLNLAYSKPAFPLDPGVLAELRLNTFTMTASGPATVRLTLEDTGYPGDGQTFTTFPLKLTNGIIGGVANGNVSVDIKSYASSGGYVPNLGAEQGVYGPLSSTAGSDGGLVPLQYTNNFSGSNVAFSSNQSVALDDAANYSMFTVIELNFAGAGDITFTQSALISNGKIEGELGGGDPQGTPEPASLMLISTGLFGLAGGARRRFKSRKA